MSTQRESLGESPEVDRDGFFKVQPGEPNDACPLCGIHRKYAGNPAACSTVNFGEPGCFAAEEAE